MSMLEGLIATVVSIGSLVKTNELTIQAERGKRK